MNGPEHYREAERIMQSAADATPDLDVSQNLAAAQVHATLALAAAAATDPHDTTARRLWHEAVQP